MHQVHKARLADGREVAVKVQYIGLETAVNADVTTLSLLAGTAARFFPGAFDFGYAWSCCLMVSKHRLGAMPSLRPHCTKAVVHALN